VSPLSSGASGGAWMMEDIGVTGQGRYDFETGAIDANVALVVQPRPILRRCPRARRSGRLV
jgi:hypothetical protein